MSPENARVLVASELREAVSQPDIPACSLARQFIGSIFPPAGIFPNWDSGQMMFHFESARLFTRGFSLLNRGAPARKHEANQRSLYPRATLRIGKRIAF